jgi:hypothetical protein
MARVHWNHISKDFFLNHIQGSRYESTRVPSEERGKGPLVQPPPIGTATTSQETVRKMKTHKKPLQLLKNVKSEKPHIYREKNL